MQHPRFLAAVPATSALQQAALHSLRERLLEFRSMAPNLSLSQYYQIRDMIVRNSLTGVQIAGVPGCSTRSVRTIRTNLGCFGTSKAPANRVGHPKSITPPMLRALRDQLIEKPYIPRRDGCVPEDEWVEVASTNPAQLVEGSWGRAAAGQLDVPLSKPCDLRTNCCNHDSPSLSRTNSSSRTTR